MTSLRDDKYFKSISFGNYRELPERQTNQIRIFLSSTFTDTHEERDYLIEKVYPRLKSFCDTTYRYEFQIVDLRWGITDQAVSSNLVSKICLGEIKNCLDYSNGPYFVAFISHRYGQRTLPVEISNAEFQTLLNEYEKNKPANLSFESKELGLDIKNLLTHCYRLDENDTNRTYLLLGADKMIENFQLKDRLHEKTFNDMQEKLTVGLRVLAESCHKKGLITADQREQYFISVTEQEIQSGILNQTKDNVDERTLVFIRSIQGYEEKLAKNIKLAKRFFEVNSNGLIDPEATALLESLKSKLNLKHSHVGQYSVGWHENDGGVTRKTEPEYFKSFAESFSERVINSIKLYAEKHRKVQYSSKEEADLMQEILDHAYLCQKYSKKFQGRKELIQRVNEFLISDAGDDGEQQYAKPLVIFGESGAGKSSLIAAVANEVSHLNALVILRFLGTTRSSSSIYKTLKSIISQIDLCFELELEYGEMRNSAECKDILCRQLEMVKAKHPDQKIFIFLDSIDQLTNSSDYDVDWMPREFDHRNFKIVCSVLANHGGILDNIKARFGLKKRDMLEVEKLDLNIANVVIQNWLSFKNRRLTQDQHNTLSSLLQNAQLYPLFIKLIFDIISTWTSFQVVDEGFRKCLSIDESIKYLFKKLEQLHGTLVFSRCCAYLTLSTNGISETELEDILSIDDEVLYDILAYHAPPSRRFPIFLWIRIKASLSEYLTVKENDDVQVVAWFHRRFFEVARVVYVDTLSSETRDSVLMNMIDYYLETWNKKPKPFKYSEHIKNKLGLASVDSEAFRYTKPQPIEYRSSSSSNDAVPVAFNKRKLNELPRIIQMISNKKQMLSLMIEHVYFDYSFIHAKTKSRDLNSLKQAEKAIWSIYNEILRENSKNKTDAAALVLMNFMLDHNSILYEEYADSLFFQLSSRLLRLYTDSAEDRFSSFISKNFEQSLRHCALVTWQANLPIIDKANATSLAYDNRPFHCVVNFHGTPFVFASSNMIYMIDSSTNRTHGKLNFEGNTNLKNYISSLRYFRVYIRDQLSSLKNLDQLKMKDLNGGILFRQKNKLYSIEFNGNFQFCKQYNFVINEFYLVSSTHAIVCVMNSRILELIDLYDGGKTLFEKVFNSRINHIACNSNQQEAFLSDYENICPIFIAVLLENRDVHVLKFNKQAKSLDLVQIIESCPNEPFKVISDSRFNPERQIGRKSSGSEIKARFAVLLDGLDVLILTVIAQPPQKDASEALIVQLKLIEVNYSRRMMVDKKSINRKRVRLDDFNKNKLLIRMGLNSFYFDNDNDKFMLINSRSKSCKFISKNLILTLSKNLISISFVKANSDLKYKSTLLLEMEAPVSTTYPQVSYIKDENLICGCEDKSLKKFDLLYACSVEMTDYWTQESEDVEVNYSNPTWMTDDCLISHLRSNKLAIKSVISKQEHLCDLVDIPKKAAVLWTSCWKDVYFVAFKKKQNLPKKNAFQLNVYTIRKSEAEDGYEFDFYYKSSISRTASHNSKRQTFDVKFGNKEFFTTFYNDETHSIHVNRNQRSQSVAENNGWSTTLLKIDLAELGVCSGPLSELSDYFCLTLQNSYLLVLRSHWIHLVDIYQMSVVFRADLSNSKKFISYDSRCKFEAIEATDDLVGLDRKLGVMAYYSLETSKFAKPTLRMFTSSTTNRCVEDFWTKKNYLVVLCRVVYRVYLKIYNLHKVRALGRFVEEFEIDPIKSWDSHSMVDISQDLKYLAIYQQPRTLMIYRLLAKDNRDNYQLIAHVPILSKIIQISIFNQHILLNQSSGKLLTLKIIDEKNPDHKDHVKAFESRNLSVEQELDGILKQLGPSKGQQETRNLEELRAKVVSKEAEEGSEKRARKRFRYHELAKCVIHNYERAEEMKLEAQRRADKPRKPMQSGENAAEKSDESNDEEESDNESESSENESNAGPRKSALDRYEKPVAVRVDKPDRFFDFTYSHEEAKKNMDAEETEALEKEISSRYDPFSYETSCLCTLL